MSGNTAFAKRVRALRESRGMSQERIAELVGYTKQAVQRWENNGQTPRNDALQIIADYFKVPLDYLLGRVDNPTDSLVPEKKQTPADTAGENPRDPVLDEIADNLKRMSPEEREAVRRLTRSVANRETKSVG